MKTFVVISDSHGRRGTVERLRGLFAENDYIVHLGDGAADMRAVTEEFPEKTYVLQGNCDLFFAMQECVLTAEGVSVLCCHGHRYGVKAGLERLARHAKELDCEVALYGHTHAASIDTVDGVLCINPGALGSYSDPSYCYLVIHEKKVTPTIVPLS